MANKTISNTFVVNTVDDGENAFEVGLDRTSIGVECDTEGNISETVSFLVTISAHYGSENVVGACTITDDHEDVDSDISVEYAPSPSHTSEPWVAKITFTQGNGLAPMLNIAFTITHSTYGTRVVALAINRVVLGKDGTNAPFYNEEWYAWSNDSSTASVTTEPTISGSWSHSIPNQGGLSYLWKKIIRYDYNASIKDYVQGSAQYYRMSGTNGTSINTKGTIKVAITASGTFPTSGFSNGDLGVKQGDSYMWQFNGSYWSHVSSASSDGDSYTMTKDCTIDLDGDGTSENIKGHLIQWSTEASKWIDLGQFKGESGVTYYTHIAWATGVTLNPSPSTKPAGQQNIPNASNVQGGVIIPSGADLPWMGYLIDTNVSDSTTYTNYTWSETKGAKGDDSIAYEIQSSIGSIKIPSNQTTVSKTITSKFYSKAGGADKQVFRTYYTIYRRATNGVYNKVSPEYATWASEATVTINNISVAYNAIVVYLWGEDYTSYYSGMYPETQAPKPYLTKLEIPIIKDGNDGQAGARGALGRSYYYAGEFNSQDESKHYVVNDAQSPFFLHIESGQKRYHVFNPAESPQSGDMTMKEMWEESDGDWNNAPWEVMNNDFKYLISEAVFADFAKFASFVMMGDFLFSLQGRWIDDLFKDGSTLVTYNLFRSGGNYVSQNSPTYSFINVDEVGVHRIAEFEDVTQNSTYDAEKNVVSGTKTLYSGIMYSLTWDTRQNCNFLLKDSQGNVYGSIDIGNNSCFQVEDTGNYYIVAKNTTQGSNAMSYTKVSLYQRYFSPNVCINGESGDASLNRLKGMANLTHLTVTKGEDSEGGDANLLGLTTIEQPYLPPDKTDASIVDYNKLPILPYYKNIKVRRKDATGAEYEKAGHLVVDDSTGALKFIATTNWTPA